MAKKKERQDQLTQWAIEAERLGMSYGAYVAQYHPETPPAVRFPKLKGDKEQRYCPVCGAPIRPESRAKYCGKVCQANAEQERMQAEIEI